MIDTHALILDEHWTIRICIYIYFHESYFTFFLGAQFGLGLCGGI